MVFLSTLISFLTIGFAIGLPLLILFQILNKKSTLLKIPSLKIWKMLLKTIGAPPRQKLNIFNLSFLLQILLLCLLAYLCSEPIFQQTNASRPTFNILINRSTSMGVLTADNMTRWDELKKVIYTRLVECGLQSDDRINLVFNPPLNSSVNETSLNQIDKIINDINVVDLPPSEMPFFQLTKMKGQAIYVTDSLEEIPNSLKDSISIIYLKDDVHINVGWVQFWVEGQTINGVIKNFSDYSLNLNIDLKLNGVSVQANDFEPAIKPNGYFYYTKTIQENMATINLIEIFITCPGDALQVDNLVALSRMQSQKLRVLVAKEVGLPVLKALRALSDSVEITLMEGDHKLSAIQYDLLVGVKYERDRKINQLVVNPREGNAFFTVLDTKVNSNISPTQWLNANEFKIFENVVVENISEIKEFVTGSKLLMETSNNWPIVSRWRHDNNLIYLLNFECSEASTMVHTPSFPFLMAKVLEDMNFNRLQSFKTGEMIEALDISNSIKVFQSNQKDNRNSINFTKADAVLLKNAGLYSSENVNICVNLLNEKESNIKQDLAGSQNMLVFQYQEQFIPFDLKPFIAALLLLIFLLEWLMYKKEN